VRGVSFIVKPSRTQLIKIQELIDNHTIRPVIFKEFPLAQARQALKFGITGIFPAKSAVRSVSCDSTISSRSNSQTSLVTPTSETQKPPPISELAFASLKAPLRPARAPVDPTDASEEREASGRRRIALYDSHKTTARPARNS
jgi:hypothetical protein